MKKTDSLVRHGLNIFSFKFREKSGFLLKNLALFFIGVYRTFGTQFLGGNCRFSPSCSDYAQQAFTKHSFFKALIMVLTRLSKCHPLGSFGYDPVPERNTNARPTKQSV